MKNLIWAADTGAGIWNRAVSGLMLLVACTVAGQASATTLVPTNLAKLSELAESAFVIQIEDVETTTTAEGKSYDVVRGTIVDPVFGNISTSETITWKQFRFGQKVRMPAMPEYKAGEEYLIFLSGPGPGTGYQSPMGLGQGTFTVKRNPQTGDAMVRSLYMNSGLTGGLDVDAIARDLVSREARARGMSPGEARQEAEKLKAKLTVRGAGISLDVLKRVAKMFHEQKTRGARPSADYRTTAPMRARTLR